MSEAPVAGTLPFLAGEHESSGGPRVLRAAGGRGSGLRPRSTGVAAGGASRAERKNWRGGLRSPYLSARLRGMANEFRYRSQVITGAQVEFVRQLIAQHPGASRRQLSRRLCEAWGWKQANGAWRDMVCRGLLLGLHRAGHIALPPARQTGFNPG